MNAETQAIQQNALIEQQDRWQPAQLGNPVGEHVAQPTNANTNARPTCAFDGCTASWGKLWRRSGRPKLEGKWGCSQNCLHALIGATVQRELRDGPPTLASHTHRVPLGLVFLAQGWITHPQLQQALAMQRAAGKGRIGDWLVEDHVLSSAQVTRGLGLQWNRPVFSIAGMDATRMALVMPRRLADHLRLLPVKLTVDNTLFLGSEDKVDASAALAIERMTGVAVESGLVTASEYAEATSRLSRVTQAQYCEEEVADEEMLKRQIHAAITETQALDSRVVRVRDRFWLRMWLERGALKSGHIPATTEDVIDHVYRVNAFQLA